MHECGTLTAPSATLKSDTSQKVAKQLKGQVFYLFGKPVRHCFKLWLKCKTTCPAYSIKTVLVCFSIGSVAPFSAHTKLLRGTCAGSEATFGPQIF